MHIEDNEATNMLVEEEKINTELLTNEAIPQAEARGVSFDAELPTVDEGSTGFVMPKLDKHIPYDEYLKREDAKSDKAAIIAGERDLGSDNKLLRNDYIDPRTGVKFGTYTEDEIRQSVIEAATVDTIFDPKSNPGDRVFKGMVAASDPRYADVKTGVIDVMGTHYDYMTKNSQAMLLMGEVTSADEVDKIAEAFTFQEEAAKIRSQAPVDYPDHGIFHRAVLATAEGIPTSIALVKEMAPEAIKDIATGALVGTAVGATGGPLAPATAPIGFVSGAAAAAAAGIPVRTFMAAKKMGKGELMLQMLNPKREGGPIPFAIAEPLAEKASYAYAGAESIGQLAMAFGITKGVSEKIVAMAGEGGTEGFQTILEQVTSFIAAKQFAEARGSEFKEDIEDYLDLYEAKLAAGQGILGAGGVSVVGAAAVETAKAPITTSVKVRDFLVNKKKEQSLEESYRITRAMEEGARITVQENSDKQVVDVQTEVTNTLVEGTPIAPAEIDRVKGDKVIRGTSITDDHLDGLTVIADDTDLEEALVALRSINEDSLNDSAAVFFTGIADFLGDTESAKVVEDITAARAQTLGLSLSQYVDKHGLQFEDVGKESSTTNATVTFTEDNKTIIRAFSNADISSVVHELGHVFKRDLQGEDQNIADEFVGVERGSTWDKRAEEKFAEAWETYLVTQEAPTQALVPVFQKLSNWLVNIYKALRDSPANTVIPKELVGVFDRMLSGRDIAVERSNVARSEAARLSTQDVTLEQQVRARIEDTEEGYLSRKKAEREAIARANVEYDKALSIVAKSKKITDDEAAMITQKALVQAMRSTFDAGDVHGYKAARNNLKAFLSRERNRYAIQRKHKAVRESIISKLKRGLPSSKADKLVVNIDPTLAKMLRDVYAVIGAATTDKAIRKLYDSMVVGAATITNPLVSQEDMIINSYLDGAVSRNSHGLNVLEALNADLAAMLKGQASKSPIRQLLKAVDQMVPTFVGEINGGFTVDTTITDTDRLNRERQSAKSWKQKISTSMLGGKVLMGLNELSQRVSSYSPSTRSSFSKVFDFHKAKQKKITRIREGQTMVQGVYKNIFQIEEGVTGRIGADKRMWDKMNEDSNPVLDIGNKVKYTRSEIRQLWMYMQDSTLTNKLVAMFNPTDNKITKDMEEAEVEARWEVAKSNYLNVVDAVEGILTDQDREYATALMNWFSSDAVYDETNSVYFKLFGIPLGRIKQYVPIRSQYLLKKDDIVDKIEDMKAQFQHDDWVRKTEKSAKSIRERTDNMYQLNLQGDTSLFTSFLEETSHFIAFGEQGQFARSVLLNPDIRQAIEVEYGRTAYQTMTESLADVLADGIYNRSQWPWLDRFRGAFVRSTIGASLSIFFKQQISAVQAWQHVPFTHFVGGITKFWLSPVENIREMYSTEYLQNRLTQVERDVKKVQGAGAYSKYKLNPTFENLMTINITLGDTLAVAQAGWVVKEYYKTQINPDTGTKYTEQEAMDYAGEVMEGTQQSGQMGQLSALQRAGSLGAFFTMYSTGPVQAARQEVEAFKDYVGGRITGKQLSKTFFIYHVLVPAMFSLAGSWLSGDDWDEEKKELAVSIALGPFGSAYSMGGVLKEAVRRMKGLKRYEQDGIASDVVFDISKIANGFVNGKELDFDDYVGAIQAATVLSGHGIPIQRATRSLENAAKGDVKGTLFSLNPDRN